MQAFQHTEKERKEKGNEPWEIPLVMFDTSPPRIGSLSRSFPGAEDWSCVTTSEFEGTSTCIVSAW